MQESGRPLFSSLDIGEPINRFTPGVQFYEKPKMSPSEDQIVGYDHALVMPVGDRVVRYRQEHYAMVEFRYQRLAANERADHKEDMPFGQKVDFSLLGGSREFFYYLPSNREVPEIRLGTDPWKDEDARQLMTVRATVVAAGAVNGLVELGIMPIDYRRQREQVALRGIKVVRPTTNQTQMRCSHVELICDNQVLAVTLQAQPTDWIVQTEYGHIEIVDTGHVVDWPRIWGWYRIR